MLEEYKICLENALDRVVAKGEDNRDFYAGKVNGIAECINIDDTPSLHEATATINARETKKDGPTD